MPGDKSITHRALLVGALAPGRSTLRGALTSGDARSTARVLRQLGVTVSPLRPDAIVHVGGKARLTAPSAALDCGNSGTTVRLLLGVLAAQQFAATVTGDRSLRRRPMRRVSEPLAAMGAHFTAAGDGLPLTIHGGRLRELAWRMPVPSAQVKSALLLAGAAARVRVVLHEPAPTRDHTERMLRQFGYEVSSQDGTLTFEPAGLIAPFEIAIPGDPSSAIFLLAAAALAADGEIRIENVGLNPTRTGFLAMLRRMGAAVSATASGESFGEPVGTLGAGPARLHSVTVLASEVPGIIDEVPMLACLAARASGTSRFAGLSELRVKESDRLAVLADNLRRVGVDAHADGDDLVVTGGDRPLAGDVVTHGDHRIAMAFAVLGTQPGSKIRIDNPACAAVSFPGFDAALQGIFSR